MISINNLSISFQKVLFPTYSDDIPKDRIGLMGRTHGKSTLMKAIAGIFRNTMARCFGESTVHGSVQDIRWEYTLRILYECCRFTGKQNKCEVY